MKKSLKINFIQFRENDEHNQPSTFEEIYASGSEEHAEEGDSAIDQSLGRGSIDAAFPLHDIQNSLGESVNQLSTSCPASFFHENFLFKKPEHDGSRQRQNVRNSLA